MSDVADYPETLHMVQMWLDTRRMTELARALSLPLHSLDTNYMVHCALGKLFQEHAPKPFSVEGDMTDATRFIRVLGYSQMPKSGLQEMARAFAEPMAYEICDFDRFAAKPMPEVFPTGVRLAFELRACPVVRKSSAGSNGKYSWSKGQEVDAFLSRVWEVGDKEVTLDREKVYQKWLGQQFNRRGGVEPITIEMTRFSLEKMIRRSHGKNRKPRPITRPDVTFCGRLEVTDGASFMELLKNGIGRHRAFGFGMLKVRRLRS